MPEMFSRDADGKISDAELWEDVLGDDDAMTWDPTHWRAFPKASDPPSLWTRLLKDAVPCAAVLAKAADARLCSYLHNYPSFVAFLRRPDRLEPQDVTVAANFTYAWMPRVAVLNAEHLEEACDALNEVRAGALPSAAHVQAVAAYLGNSIVGASKLLHFTAPSTHAIWDTRVARYLGIKNIDRSRDAGIHTYLSYLRVLKDLSSYPYIDTMRIHAKAWGMDITPLRAIEMVMFLSREAAGAD